MRGKFSVIELDERTPCVCCGERPCFEKGYGPDYGVCHVCAHEITDLYFLVHSGERAFSCEEDAPPKRRPVPQTVKWQVLRRDGFMCQHCGREDVPLQVDHIYPQSKGGGNEPENLQALCAKCNQSKKDKVDV